MPNRYKQSDLNANDAFALVEQLQTVGHQLDVDVTDGLLNFSAMEGKQHTLMVDFSNAEDVKVTSHIGNTRIEHPTLKAGVNTFIANVIEKDRKGIN